MSATPAKASLPCWICGNPGDSGEHKAKKSDLKAVFPPPSQRAPLFLNDANFKNKRVGGFSGDALKWSNKLCHICNTARTQPHDQAWEKLSTELRKRRDQLAPGSAVRANKIFPNNTAATMLDVHLYFAKAFGCLIVEGDAPIDIADFARAIIRGKPHPDLYLQFGRAPDRNRLTIVSASDLHLFFDHSDNSLALATWFYDVDGVWVNVIYAPGSRVWAAKRKIWHPDFGTNRLTMADFASDTTTS